jgi:hypothetical protein
MVGAVVADAHTGTGDVDPPAVPRCLSPQNPERLAVPSDEEPGAVGPIADEAGMVGGSGRDQVQSTHKPNRSTLIAKFYGGRTR